MSNKPWDVEHIAFREALRELRHSQELNQQDVADQLGRPQSYISKYENGERRLEYLEVIAILDIFEHTIEEFHALYLTKVAEHKGQYLHASKGTRKSKRKTASKTTRKTAKKRTKKTRAKR